MAYCTTTDVYTETGSATGTANIVDIGNMIARSDEEINDILKQKGLTPPTTATQLKTASICLTIAKIKRRQGHELSRPNSMGLSDGTSFSTSPEVEAQAYEAKARIAIDTYVAYAGGSGVAIVRNHRMIRGY